MNLPYINSRNYTIESITSFKGLNLTDCTSEGESSFEENLSSKDYPMLSVRNKRAELYSFPEAVTGICNGDKLAFVKDNTLYYNGIATGLDNLSPGEKQIVPLGAYLCIFPDKVYYNTAADTDFGSMEAHFQTSQSIAFAMCTVSGENLSPQHTGAVRPANPAHGDYWLRTSGEGYGLYVYDSDTDTFSSVAAPYTRITLPTKGSFAETFFPGDAVVISNSPIEDLNGSKLIHGVFLNEAGYDCIVVTGLCPGALSGSGIKIDRNVPDMNYVCSAQNRLWGCFFGSDGVNNLNEIYACALGDFRNWQSFSGISTDSYTASVGSPGPFTAAVNFFGSPCFFKEDRLHKVTVSAVGAHRVSDTPLRGVMKGCAKSAALSGDTLIYKSREGFMAWQGSFPVLISQKLGNMNKAVCTGAESVGGLYYAELVMPDGKRHLLCYDSEKDLWHREDGLAAEHFGVVNGRLLAVSGGKIISINPEEGDGIAEEAIHWEYTTGSLNFAKPGARYLFIVSVRLATKEAVGGEIFVEYDSNGNFIPSGSFSAQKSGSVLIPIRPRRCDSLKIKLSGTGRCSIASISYRYEKGSRRIG